MKQTQEYLHNSLRRHDNKSSKCTNKSKCDNFPSEDTSTTTN